MSDNQEKEENSEKSWWTEAVKDLTSAGLATFFMTEESVRNYLREKKLPKELVGLFIENMGKKKNDLYSIIGKEVGAFLSKMDLSKEAASFLENHRVHFEGKISFEPKDSKNKDV
jgi:hypothetical protein